MARLLSVNVGLPRDVDWKGRIVHTGIWKNPVRGRCRVGRLNLDGDGQGDLDGHGGEQRAVFVYQIESYRHWQEQLKRTDFVHGQFGENFTIEGLPDDAACIGDIYQIGNALFEITQPRVTCYRVGIRMNEPRMPALLTSSGRPGFYFRVLREGEVGAGDEIVKVAEANERMTVAEINALLYSPNHPHDRLERALRIEALSRGWRSSFEALLQSQTTAAGSGNAGLAPAAAAHPVAPGFRPLAVAAIDQESVDVLSLSMRHSDGQPLPPALPGQYVIVRIQRRGGGPPLFRSYSLSGSPSMERYRISVKIEPNGAAGTYLREHIRLGDVLDVSSPRGSFILQSGERPIVLLSAGIGVTPVLAMLYALASARSTCPVWWLHAARDRHHHPFAAEVRSLMPSLNRGRSYVCYSRPGSDDKMGEDFDAAGHLSRSVFDEIGIPREADAYLCGPARFMAEIKRRSQAWAWRRRGFTSNCSTAASRGPLALSAQRRELPIRPRTTPAPVRGYRSREVASPYTGRRRPTRAFWSWPRRATSRSAGHAGPVSVTTARAVWFRARSPIDRSRSICPPTATFSFAARNRLMTSSSICES